MKSNYLGCKMQRVILRRANASEAAGPRARAALSALRSTRRIRLLAAAETFLPFLRPADRTTGRGLLPRFAARQSDHRRAASHGGTRVRPARHLAAPALESPALWGCGARSRIAVRFLSFLKARVARAGSVHSAHDRPDDTD